MKIDIKKIFSDASSHIKHKKLARGIALGTAAVFLVSLVFFLYGKITSAGEIKVSGNIDGNEVRISFRVTGQIEELMVDEGWVLREGDIVARLNVDELSKEKEEAAAALRRAEHQYELDNLDYIRSQNLFDQGAISAQERDVALTKSSTDKAEVDELRASFEIAATRLGWADLASPLNGYITLKSALRGEVVQEGAPVFTAIDLNDLWVTAYIEEGDLGKVKLGQKAAVYTDSYPGKKYNGEVSFISAQTEFTPKYIQTTKERVKYVYRIKVRVDNSSLDMKPGMPADAYIAVK